MNRLDSLTVLVRAEEKALKAFEAYRQDARARGISEGAESIAQQEHLEEAYVTARALRLLLANWRP